MSHLRGLKERLETWKGALESKRLGVSAKKKKKTIISNENAFSFFFFLLFGEKVHVAIPFSASFSRVGCIKDGVVSDINSNEKSNMC